MGRTVAGFMIGLFLGIVGGWLAAIFNSLAGCPFRCPWELEIHRNIYLVCVGLGAGVGAYSGWMSLALRWHLIAASLLLVILGGVAGTYLGHVYGQNVGPTYLGRAYTIDNWLHFGAAIGTIAVSTALGMFNEFGSTGN